MGTRAAQTDPGDDRRYQRVHGRHARTDSADSQATVVDDDAQLVLAAKRPSKRAVDEDDADEVSEAKRLRVTPGTVAEPTDAQTGSPEPAALNTVSNITAAAPAVVADPNQRISQLLCDIVTTRAASVRPTDGDGAAPAAPPTVSDRVAAVNQYTSVKRRATAAQVAAQDERERHEAAERARVEEIARRCLPVKAPPRPANATSSRAPPFSFNMVHSRPPRFSRLQAGDNGVNNWQAVAEDKNLINRNHSHLACIEKDGGCADHDVAPCPCCVDDEETDRLRYRVALAAALSFI